MRAAVPSYITRSKHGVYYFQLRVSVAYAQKLNIKPPLYRKSLRTKDRREAVSLARRYWVKIQRKLIMGCDMTSNEKDLSTDDFLKLQDSEAELRLRKSVRINLALDFTRRFNTIPE